MKEDPQELPIAISNSPDLTIFYNDTVSFLWPKVMTLFIHNSIEGVKDNFDLEKGNKFSTYAHHYVLGRIRRAIEQYNNLIRKPAYINIAGLKLLDVDEDISDIELEKYRNDRYSISQLRNAINAKKQKIVGEEELEFEVVQVPDYNRICNKDLVMQVLNCLKDRELSIVKMRFGLDDYDPHTFKEIDKKLGCDSEQIMRASFIKLRAKFRFEDLLEVFRWS